MSQNYEIKSDTCPYCGAPYKIEFRGCRDKCEESEIAKELIRDALQAGWYANGEEFEMKFQKQFATWKWGNNPTRDEYQSQRCALMSNVYNHSLEVVNRMMAIVKADFSNIMENEVEVVTYGGKSHNGIVGLEFDPGSDHSIVPVSWQRVPELEVHR